MAHGGRARGCQQLTSRLPYSDARALLTWQETASVISNMPSQARLRAGQPAAGHASTERLAALRRRSPWEGETLSQRVLGAPQLGLATQSRRHASEGVGQVQGRWLTDKAARCFVQWGRTPVAVSSGPTE